jgi:DUF1707 SHOCT-like domain
MSGHTYRKRGARVNGDILSGGGPSRDPDLRASDAERDAVATELGEHFQAGRLTQAEFDDRLGRALAARTRRDLDGLLADLPRKEAPTPVPAPRRSNVVAPVVVAVALGLAAVAVIGTGVAAASGHRFWGPWWLIFVVFVLLRRAGWSNRHRR